MGTGVHVPACAAYRGSERRYAGLLVPVTQSRRSRFLQGSSQGWTDRPRRSNIPARNLVQQGETISESSGWFSRDRDLEGHTQNH